MTFIGNGTAAVKHGPQAGKHLLTFEEAALGQYVSISIVEAENIECDMHVMRAMDVCFREDDALPKRTRKLAGTHSQTI